MLPIAAQAASEIDISGTIVRLLAFILGMCGSLYLAASLWRRAEKGSESWKYLAVSMMMLSFWNIIMAFSVMMTVLNIDRPGRVHDITFDYVLFIIKILDPIIEVTVFLILLFGLKKIIKAIREEPWTVFKIGRASCRERVS
jgi:hypothetical protein